MRAITGLLGAVAVALTAAPAAGAAGLAYTTGGAKSFPSVWAADANGSHAHRLGPGTFPALAPNGAMVAAASGSGSGAKSALVIYSTRGGDAKHTFFNVNKVGTVALAWSPDSRYLAVALQDTTATRKVGNSAVTIIDTTTFATTKVASGVVQGVSFAPTTDTLVYGLSAGQNFGSKTNLFSVPASGGTPIQLTTDGHSYFPVWGKLGIAYDEVQYVTNKAPAYSIYLLNQGRMTQITHQKVTLLQDGLMPTAVSADGRHLLASFIGEDTDNAVTIDLVTHKRHNLKVKGVPPVGYGISEDGKRVLIDVGGFENPPQDGTVESIPFAGGKPTVLQKHCDEPSWDR